MSETDTKSGIGGDKIAIGAVIVVILLVLAFAGSQRQTDLRNSATGMDGLRMWLTSEGKDAQSFTGGWQLSAEEVGLLIVPLYDTDLTASRTRPKTTEELLQQIDENDLTFDVIEDRADLVDTMIVLPKWRSGMRLTQIAHSDLLIPVDRLEALGDSLTKGPGFDLRRSAAPFDEIPYTDWTDTPRRAQIYAAQRFSAPGCRPLIGDFDGMILGDCKLEGQSGARIYVLSDPDLVNNHGLAMGDNAYIVRDVIGSLTAEGQVIVDYSRRNWVTTFSGRSQRERTWDDMLRFFSPPFTLIWIGSVIALALMLWRAGLRFGPLARGPRIGSASKALAIAARARLMLLSRRPGAMVDDYMRARLAAAATTLFGHAHGRKMATPEAFLDYTKRRHPQHVAPLTSSLNAIATLPDGTSSRHAMAIIDDLDRILEKITHDT